MDATTVAVDLAKSVFELAIANARWRVWSRQRLNRARFARFLAQTPPTHVVMEACGTAHYWGRVAQRHGHRVTPWAHSPWPSTHRCDCAAGQRSVDRGLTENRNGVRSSLPPRWNGLGHVRRKPLEAARGRKILTHASKITACITPKSSQRSAVQLAPRAAKVLMLETRRYPSIMGMVCSYSEKYRWMIGRAKDRRMLVFDSRARRNSNDFSTRVAADTRLLVSFR